MSIDLESTIKPSQAAADGSWEFYPDFIDRELAADAGRVVLNLMRMRGRAEAVEDPRQSLKFPQRARRYNEIGFRLWKEVGDRWEPGYKVWPKLTSYTDPLIDTILNVTESISGTSVVEAVTISALGPDAKILAHRDKETSKRAIVQLTGMAIISLVTESDSCATTFMMLPGDVYTMSGSNGTGYTPIHSVECESSPRIAVLI